MKIPFTCQACGDVTDVEWSQIGRDITCGGCGDTATVPAPMETIGEPDQPARALRFACPACGRKFATKPDLAGKKIRCNRCGAGVRVPGGDASTAGQPSRASLNAHRDSSDETTAPQPARTRAIPAEADSDVDDEPGASSSLIETPGSQAKPKRRRRAPVLSSRSQMMEHIRQREAEEERAQTPENVSTIKKKKRKKKKKRSGYFDLKETLTLVGGVGALVAVLTFLAWGYPEFRFPLGGLLSVIGFIVYLLGAHSLRQLVAEEGIFKLLLFRFCPPYQWWYVATNWAETKDFVAFFGAGVLIMSMGGAIIKTSPTGKKAEASERAYQKAQQGRRAEAPPPVARGIVEADD